MCSRYCGSRTAICCAVLANKRARDAAVVAGVEAAANCRSNGMGEEEPAGVRVRERESRGEVHA